MNREFLFYIGAIIALFILLLGCLFANPVNAQEARPTTPSCAPLAEVVGYLESEHKEKLRWFGNITGGARLFIVDSKNGTWTVIQTDGRRACIIFAGDGSKFQLGERA